MPLTGKRLMNPTHRYKRKALAGVPCFFDVGVRPVVRLTYVSAGVRPVAFSIL